VFLHTCDTSTAPCLHATVLTVSLISFAKEEAKLRYDAIEAAKSCGPSSLCGHFERDLSCHGGMLFGQTLTAWFG
jgi:hypothetical protein